MEARNRDAILEWLERIEKSELPMSTFFEMYQVPFSRAQYFLYKKRFQEDGLDGILDRRKTGGNRKITCHEETFLKGCIKGNPDVSLRELQEALKEEFHREISLSAISRALNRILPGREHKRGGKPTSKPPEVVHNALGGFELIIAVAYHLGWPERTAGIIGRACEALKRSAGFESSRDLVDRTGRNPSGHFTKDYNQHQEVRANRFGSISEKRQHKNWHAMNLLKDHPATLARKSLAILSLPVVTGNGQVRSVDLARGQALGHFCGFNYKQSSITKCLAELKYLGASSYLLPDLPEFWRQCWEDTVSDSMIGPLLCYYIDGNTKALWSSKRVKQNKVTMLGRVMGCVEQVFIHDGFGHPIYFETYAGHGPVGERILGLFESIEETILCVPRGATHVCRAIVMDAANNSVGTLRAFAAQDTFHYITTLDDNQWDERRVRSRSDPTRYRYGEATLRDLDIELEDSKERGYLIVSRSIKIDWDHGKRTVLLTSIPRDIVDGSEIVFSYFRRWPAQELPYRYEKATVSLSRIAGYGRKQVENLRQLDAQEKLAQKISVLQEQLQAAIDDINVHEHAIARLIPKERRIRMKTKIIDGRRIVPKELQDDFDQYGKEIRFHQKAIKAIEKRHEKEFQTFTKSQREWLRLQGKEYVYEIDVEMDQILTYFRASLVHLYGYFIQHFLGGQPIGLVMLLHRLIQLPAEVEETKDSRRITLQYNKQDPTMMKQLKHAIDKLNAFKIQGPKGKTMYFSLGSLN